jgi:hypothetical protein
MSLKKFSHSQNSFALREQVFVYPATALTPRFMPAAKESVHPSVPGPHPNFITATTLITSAKKQPAAAASQKDSATKNANNRNSPSPRPRQHKDIPAILRASA